MLSCTLYPLGPVYGFSAHRLTGLGSEGGGTGPVYEPPGFHEAAAGAWAGAALPGAVPDPVLPELAHPAAARATARPAAARTLS